MLCADGKVVDVELSPRPLELREFVGHEPSYDFFARQGHQRDHVVTCEQGLQVSIARRFRRICLRIIE
jgi:hypothetical protein